MKVDQFTTTVASTNYFESQSRQAEHQAPQIKKAKESNEINKDDVQLAVNNVNEFLEPVVTDLKFVYHEDLNDYYVTIIDPSTNEVIREIPPKKMLDIYVAMAEYMRLLVDERVYNVYQMMSNNGNASWWHCLGYGY